MESFLNVAGLVEAIASCDSRVESQAYDYGYVAFGDCR